MGIDFGHAVLQRDLHRPQFRRGGGEGAASKGLAFRDDEIPFLSGRRL